MRCNCVTYTSSGGESTRAPPVAQSPVLEDLPENGVGDARRALRRRPGAARRRASGRRGGSAEEARNHFGRRCGHGGAAARQQRAESKQLLVVLQNVLLIGTGEAHSINDVYDIDNFLSVYVSIILKTEPRHLLKSFRPCRKRDGRLRELAEGGGPRSELSASITASVVRAVLGPDRHSRGKPRATERSAALLGGSRARGAAGRPRHRNARRRRR